jgi:hypothetical protein
MKERAYVVLRYVLCYVTQPMIRKGTERISASKAKATRFAHTQMESPVEESDLANIETVAPSNWRKNYEYQEIKKLTRIHINILAAAPLIHGYVEVP